jgi:hypothetical protein
VRSGVALLLALSVAPIAAAQEPAPAPECCGSWITATYGGGGGSPHGAYASLGFAVGDVRYSGSLVGLRRGRGVLLQGDVGQHAGGLSIGMPAPFLLKMPRSWEPFGAPLVGIVPKATLVRTWHPDEPRRTYLGVTAELVVLVHLRLGVLWRVSGPSGEEQIITWGVGLGL